MDILLHRTDKYIESERPNFHEDEIRAVRQALKEKDQVIESLRKENAHLRHSLYRKSRFEFIEIDRTSTQPWGR